MLDNTSVAIGTALTESSIRACRPVIETSSGDSDGLVLVASSSDQDLGVVGAPHVDLFVTDENHKIPVYVSPLPDEYYLEAGRVLLPMDESVGVRVPTDPIGEPIARIHRKKSGRGRQGRPSVAVTTMVQQAAGTLRGPPTRVTTHLVTPETTENEPVSSGPTRLSLHVGRLSSLPSVVRDFQETCLSASLPDSDSAPGQSTIAAGVYSVTGAPYRIRTPSLPLPR